jgi:hypothetical protein
MASTLHVAVALALLLPAASRAASDPPLHVDPSLKDCSVKFAPELTQGAFARFAREFGSVSAFKQASPPTTLGQWRFALGIEMSSFSVEEHAAAWNDTFAHPDPTHELGSEKRFPKLRLRMGVTDDLDIGAYYTENPEANYGWLGLEAKYGLLRQGEDMPVSVSLRGAYTKTLYVTDMDMHALTLDVAVGRTFWRVLTPYLGVGADAVLARETSAAVNLKTEAPFVPHLAAGLEVRLWRVSLGFEAQVAAITNYEAQLSFVF